MKPSTIETLCNICGGIIMGVVFAAMLVYSIPNHAAEFEIGVGQTQFTPSDAGIWWQRGLPHHIETESRSLELGITDKFTDSLRWRASYLYLGEVNTWAVATTDKDYTGGGCRANPCEANNTYIGRGVVEGFKFSLAHEWVVGNNVKLFLEGGVYAFLARFHMTVLGSSGTETKVYFDKSRKDLWAIKPMIGAGVEYNKWQLSFSGYAVDPWSEDGDTVPNFTGYAYNLTLRKLFN